MLLTRGGVLGGWTQAGEGLPRRTLLFVSGGTGLLEPKCPIGCPSQCAPQKMCPLAEIDFNTVTIGVTCHFGGE